MTKSEARFADEYGMSPRDVGQLVVLADQAFVCNEKACNGDPILVPGFPGSRTFIKITDKPEASRLWSLKLSETTKQIERLIEPYGFTAVVYTGLRPTLKRGEQFVEVPS